MLSRKGRAELYGRVRKLSPALEKPYSIVGELLQLCWSNAPGLPEKDYQALGNRRLLPPDSTAWQRWGRRMVLLGIFSDAGYSVVFGKAVVRIFLSEWWGVIGALRD